VGLVDTEERSVATACARGSAIKAMETAATSFPRMFNLLQWLGLMDTSVLAGGVLGDLPHTCHCRLLHHKQ
jgi:hypothetical protein